MPTNTPDQQIPLPVDPDTADNPVAFNQFVGAVEQRLVRLYTDVADRTARQLTVAENEISGLATEDRIDAYDGTNNVSLYTRSLHDRFRLAANHSLTLSSTAFQNITGFTIDNLPTAGTFGFRGIVFYDSSATADIKFAITIPAGATFLWGAHGLATTATTNTGDITLATQATSGTSVGAFAGIGVGTIVYVTLQGEITMGGTAGSMQLQSAQNTVDATQSTIRSRSYWEAWRIA